MNLLHSRQVPLSLSTANSLAFNQLRPLYVLGPPTHNTEFSPEKVFDVVKQDRPQNLGMPFCLTSHGFRVKIIPQHSQTKLCDSTHIGFLSPLTDSDVKAFAGLRPFLNWLPFMEGPRILRTERAHLPPHDRLQKTGFDPFFLLVNSLPHCLHVFVVFIHTIYTKLTKIKSHFMGSGSTGKAAIKEGFGFIGIDKIESHFAIAEARIKHAAAKYKRQTTLF